MSNTRVRVNGPDVMHETIDGEVIVINLTSGNYYSVRGVGADIWSRDCRRDGAAPRTRERPVAALHERPR